jgi:ATP-dependent helicase/nuclease subunit B
VHVVFDLDFDAGCWPGPAPVGAAVGEAWVGPMGFLDRLEVSLGLQGVFPSQVDRVLALVPRLTTTSGFWDASASADPLGSAQRLLEWRDHLWECGWRGEKTGAPRLDQLSILAADVTGGFEDRLATVADVLERRGVDIDKVELGTPRELLPRSWIKVLDRLVARRVRVRISTFPPAKSHGNLGAARHPGFVPTPGDTSLQLVRPPGPLAAAELVAAFLRSLDDLGDVVVVGGDAVLDAQLRRFALPTTGGEYTGAQNAYSQLLTATCELAWRPTHPARAFEFLTHPDGPIPQALARRLTRALQDWPSTSSPSFSRAIDEGLASIEDVARRFEVAERLQLFLSPVAEGNNIASLALIPRIKKLGGWLRGKAALHPPQEPDLHSAAHACEAFLRLLSDGPSTLSRQQLRQLLKLASPSSSPTLSFPAQAGLRGIARPGGVAAPVDRIVWWNFTEASHRRPRAIPLTAAERGALKTIGVSIATAGELAQRSAARYKRPLWRATKNLILVCPQTGYDGEQTHPHPLWDEIVAHLKEREQRSLLERPQPVYAAEPPRAQRILLPQPLPTRQWNVSPALVQPRDRESPSSLESLLGCSLKWTLHYQARISPGLARPVRVDEQIYGATAHELLAMLANGGALTSPDAGDQAANLFDTHAPKLATSLFLAGADNERSLLRQTVVDSARQLASLFIDHGFKLVDAEKERVRAAGPFSLLGKTDLLLAAPDGRLVVIDLKWGGESHRRESLKAGTALQLAAYAFLVADECAEHPVTGFYILRRHRLMTDTVGVLPNAEELAFVPSNDVWTAVVAGYRERLVETVAGTIVAGGIADAVTPEPREAAELVEGRLLLPASCGFCELKDLCGRRQQEAG